MSNNYYNEIWHVSQYDVDELANEDLQYQHDEAQLSVSALMPISDSPDAVDPRALLQTKVYEYYLRYILVANKLEEVYDKMIQPQKRLILRNLFDACLGRITELKQDLVNLDLMEFSYNEVVIERLKLTPPETELNIPRYFLRERREEVSHRKQMMHEILVKLGWLDQGDTVEVPTECEAIRLLQIHERARQGRLRAHFMKEIRMSKAKNKSNEDESAGGVNCGGKVDTGLMAAMRIQKMWRGYTARCKTRRRNFDEMVLIGMVPAPLNVQKERAERMANYQKIYLERYELQDDYNKIFEKKSSEISEEIRHKRGPTMAEDMADELRVWIKDCYEKTGKLPDFPSEDQGGSAHIFSRPGTESELSRSSARSSKESRKTKDKTKSPTRSGDINTNFNQEEQQTGFAPTQSQFIADITTEIENFKAIWQHKDESENLKQAPYEDMIYAEKQNEIEMELRRGVDEVMRMEIEMLQTATGKKLKKSNKKTRRSGKKSKKKKEKDLTPDRTTESLYEELVTNGIIRQYPEVRLQDYLGDKALANRNGLNPSLGDIRQIITEYCILQLGCDTVRKNGPLMRSILLAGPKGTGLRYLVHAICTEVGAVLFDLTPANIVGRYPGKSGLIMLLHLILKVSRLLQPAVIFMADAERPFMKKVPKTDRTDPKRLKKDLSKLIKNIAPEDRVIFIGTSTLPWEADQKLFTQTYNRFIYIPRPDFGALSFAWKTFLHNYSGGLANLDYSTMAKISDGYTIGSIDKCVKEVLTCKRKLQLRSQPLTYAEFINTLSTKDPVYREEEEAFESWWAKTPLGRRYQRAQELKEELLLEQQAQNAKAGNGNKKN